jgi:hypothetical protein
VEKEMAVDGRSDEADGAGRPETVYERDATAHVQPVGVERVALPVDP